MSDIVAAVVVTDSCNIQSNKTRYEISAKHYFDSLKLVKKTALLEVQSVKPAAKNERDCFEQKDYRCAAIEYFSRIIETDPKTISRIVVFTIVSRNKTIRVFKSGDGFGSVSIMRLKYSIAAHR